MHGLSQRENLTCTQVTCAGDIFLFHSLLSGKSKPSLFDGTFFDMRGIIKYDMALTLKMNTKMDERCFYDALIYYRINEFDSERGGKMFLINNELIHI